MNPDVSGAPPSNQPLSRIFGRVRFVFAVCLLAVLVICVVLSWATRDAMAHLPFLNQPSTQADSSIKPGNLVDLRPWQTAQALAALAVTAEELNHAHEAERLADHEVDQAFASALRRASLQQRTLTGEALALSQKIKQLEQVVKDDQERVRVLTPPSGGSSNANAPQAVALTDDLEIAKAQLGLDSDELADAQQDLARASGDQRGEIQQELAAHEAAMKKYDSGASDKGQVAILSAHRYGTVAGQIGAWQDQRTRLRLIEQARTQTRADIAALAAEHRKLEQNASLTASNGESDKAAKLSSLKNRATRSQILSIYDDRIQTEQQLATVYGKWLDQVRLQHRILDHLLVQSFGLLAFIVLCVILLDALARHLVTRPSLDGRRMQTLKTILELGIQVAGVVVVLLVIFGAPRQMPTILGLATAGLTVVLQDFIIAFFGWFVLMGKHGIRIGDWVEINGVGGEVIEIGVFRTALLETGNWTGKGHPTGRRVTFTNSFAITGQYFNFSTAGQWMWDEIRVGIPPSENTSEVLQQIEQAVGKETEKDTDLAEAEWKRATKQNGLSQFPASPSVNLRPGTAGIDVIVRFVTRASDRFEVRNRVYERVIEVTHKLRPAEPVASGPA